MASVSTRATLDDRYREEGKAELIGGRIVRTASGYLPGRVAGNIFVSFRLHTKTAGKGQAHADGVGYAVPELPSGRESFSPDPSCFFGRLPMNPMRFIEGALEGAVKYRGTNHPADFLLSPFPFQTAYNP